jgi:hypothetical protein
MQTIVMLTIMCAKRDRLADRHCTECQHVECCYSACHYAECRYAESHLNRVLENVRS